MYICVYIYYICVYTHTHTQTYECIYVYITIRLNTDSLACFPSLQFGELRLTPQQRLL